MPNWASHRMIFTGPDYEVQRFVETCIRPLRDEREISFDFEAVVPMPEPIVRTLDDGSQAAQDQAHLLTGYKSWYDWSLAYWGTKWNCSGFAELFREPGRYDCFFQTAWSYPT